MKPLASLLGERLDRLLIDPLRRVPPLRHAYGEMLVAGHALKNLLPQALESLLQGPAQLPRQTIATWPSRLRASSISDLIERLDEDHLEYSEGKHTVYLPPQPGLAKSLGDFIDLYPPTAGFKILKAGGAPNSASYLADRSRWVTRTISGRLSRQAAAAGVLYAFGLGPRIYDLVAVSFGDILRSCFVVENVQGSTPTFEEYERFMTQLRYLLGGPLRGCIGLLSPQQLEHGDFQGPDCNGNLITGVGGSASFVDFQQFVVTNRRKLIREILRGATAEFHFGLSRLFRGGGPYLYQSVPGIQAGKRDSRRRWASISTLLSRIGVSPRDRVFLDVGCNAGMMLAYALGEGARWGVGWDLPPVVTKAERLQAILGYTRLHFEPASLGEDYAIERNVPHWLSSQLQGSIVLYLAMTQHIGIIRSLNLIPWRVIVFEGHQGEANDSADRKCAELQRIWDCRLALKGRIADGDSTSRPIAVLVRD